MTYLSPAIAYKVSIKSHFYLLGISFRGEMDVERNCISALTEYITVNMQIVQKTVFSVNLKLNLHTVSKVR